VTLRSGESSGEITRGPCGPRPGRFVTVVARVALLVDCATVAVAATSEKTAS
jgi:hypothetical protein